MSWVDERQSQKLFTKKVRGAHTLRTSRAACAHAVFPRSPTLSPHAAAPPPLSATQFVRKNKGASTAGPPAPAKPVAKKINDDDEWLPKDEAPAPVSKPQWLKKPRKPVGSKDLFDSVPMTQPRKDQLLGYFSMLDNATLEISSSPASSTASPAPIADW